jgi:hypothetical protein
MMGFARPTHMRMAFAPGTMSSMSVMDSSKPAAGLVRHPGGNYDLHQVLAAPGRALVATRAIRGSPFPEERGAIYLTGYDANKAPVHDTAWIYRATASATIDAAR